jgi:hypothetical protein
VGVRPPRLSLEEFDRSMDAAVNKPFIPAEPPDVPYHYTSWGGFEGILLDRAFRGTAHDCTNDPKELRAVDDIACAVAKRIRYLPGGSGARAQLMTKFGKWFPDNTMSKTGKLYLACFTSARDEPTHWTEYANQGTGVCFGLRLLRNEAPPEEDPIPPADHPLGRSTLQVDYDGRSCERRIEQGFMNVVAVYERFIFGDSHTDDRDRARLLALGGLARVTGLAATGAKEAQWEDEHEWRHVAIPWRGSEPTPLSRLREDGTRVEYVMLPIRGPGRLLVLDEVIIGSKEDFATGEARVCEILTKAGYPSQDAPIPRISRSRLSP